MCGKSSWIYNIDKFGNILEKSLHEVPNDVEKFGSDLVSSKIKEEYEYDIEIYNDKKEKQSSNLSLSIGGASSNLIFFIIFLAAGIVFLKKKPEELPKKKKNKKKNIPKSNINKPVGIGLIVLGILCFLSIGLMGFFVMSTLKKQKELIKPVTPEEYDYKRLENNRKE
jgi:hypothetical protein